MIREYIEDNPSAYIKYIPQEVNQGKGAAVHVGIANATGDYLIIQDADLEYNPNEYSLMLAPILSGDADVVYGSRFMGGNPHRILFFWHTFGNKILTLISNLFTNMNLTDAHTCYKVIPTNLIRRIPLKEKRFDFDAEFNVKLSSIPNIRIYEVGISHYERGGIEPENQTPRRRKAVAHRMERVVNAELYAYCFMDFVSDALFDGRKFRALTILDNFSRERLAIYPSQSLRRTNVIEVPNKLI